MNAILDYFDLQSQRRKKVRSKGNIELQTMVDRDDLRNVGEAATPQFAPVWPQYIALVLGIVADPFIKNYIATKSFGLDLTAFGPLLAFSIVMGIMILPGVYKNSFAPDKPILVQLAAIFTAGVGWQTLFDAAAKTVT